MKPPDPMPRMTSNIADIMDSIMKLIQEAHATTEMRINELKDETMRINRRAVRRDYSDLKKQFEYIASNVEYLREILEVLGVQYASVPIETLR